MLMPQVSDVVLLFSLHARDRHVRTVKAVHLRVFLSPDKFCFICSTSTSVAICVAETRGIQLCLWAADLLYSFFQQSMVAHLTLKPERVRHGD